MKFSLLLLCLLGSLSLSSQVVINELLASSDSLSNYPDEYGEYDDWVELHNLGSSTVDLSNYYITDTDSTLTKWQFPIGTNIAGEGYLIIWTDKDENNGQVPLHTNFRLNAGGEMVILSDANETIVDQVTFGEQTANLSYARIPNGTGDFKVNLITPGAFNEPLSTNIPAAPRLLVFPNPATDFINIRLEEPVEHPIPYEIIDAQGKVINQGLLKQEAQIATTQLSAGSYFIRYRVDKVQGLVPFQKK